MQRKRLVEFIIGGPDGDMPDRVRQAIRGQQVHSEQLIAWVQLAVVTIFGALYVLAPKTAMSNPWLSPVALALAFYFLFTLLRLHLAHRGHIEGWFLNLSVVLDIALLMVLIWSFHLQYAQPASFSLKAPTLLYVFIFIALRALRFEPRYVVMCGAAAALGWLALVAYAITVTYPDTMITRNYVTYLTSNSVLLGAEFDKVISILLVTAIIAIALMRARRLLERAVAETAAARDLSRFFPPEIARQITQSEHRIKAGEGEAREAAILSVDIRGFTVLCSRLDPSQLIALLTDYESRMVAVIQAHGGTVDKFLGDGILASFGAAVPSADYAAAALRAVDGLVAAADGWNDDRRARGEEPIRIGVAVASGRIIFGAIGDDTRLEYTCIGDPVNLSAKLEKHNSATGTRALTDGETYDMAVRQGYVPPRPHLRAAGIPVAGVAAPVELVTIDG